MDSLIISTDRLISASEARNKFGKLLDDISTNEGNYFVILDNGKVTALLVHPQWLKEKNDEKFPDLEELRSDWNRYSAKVTEAVEHIASLDQDALPALLK